MALFSRRLPDDLAAAFDAAAKGHGGRSALLHRLVTAVVEGDVVSTAVAVPKRSGPATRRIEALFTADDFALIEHAAAEMAMTRSAWLAVVARRRIHQQPKPTPRDLRELVNILTVPITMYRSCAADAALVSWQARGPPTCVCPRGQ